MDDAYWAEGIGVVSAAGVHRASHFVAAVATNEEGYSISKRLDPNQKFSQTSDNAMDAQAPGAIP